MFQVAWPKITAGDITVGHKVNREITNVVLSPVNLLVHGQDRMLRDNCVHKEGKASVSVP